jgi:hypothetical protein
MHIVELRPNEAQAQLIFFFGFNKPNEIWTGLYKIYLKGVIHLNLVLVSYSSDNKDVSSVVHVNRF